MQQPAHPSAAPIPEEQFAVAGTASTTRPRRTLKHGDTFILVDSHGDIGVVPDGADGLFNSDTRFLSLLALTLEGSQPLLLGSNLYDDNSMLTVDLTNPDLWRGGTKVLPKDTVHIVRTLFLWQGTAYQRLAVGNYGDATIDLHLALTFDADFADLFEVRGTPRRRRGTMTRSLIEPSRVLLSYRGLDNKLRRTVLAFDPDPTVLQEKSATWRFTLAPGEVKRIYQFASCDSEMMRKPQPFMRGLRAARRDLRNATRNATTVETGND